MFHDVVEYMVELSTSEYAPLLGDPLIVRSGSAMEPTPRALELVGPLRHALGIIRTTLSAAPPFDPLQSSQLFRVCSGDDLELTLLPRLLAHLKEHAPNINIEMTGIGGRAEAGLASGQIDLYLGVWFKLPSHLHHHVLRKETFVCIARRNHPVIKTRLTMKRYLEAGHVLVAPSERPGSVIDAVLASEGRSRRVVLRTPHFLTAPLVVAQTDLIATLPRSVATTCQNMLPLKVFKAPVESPGFSSQMVWHPRTHSNRAHRWLREVTKKVAAGGPR